MKSKETGEYECSLLLPNNKDDINYQF